MNPIWLIRRQLIATSFPTISYEPWTLEIWLLLTLISSTIDLQNIDLSMAFLANSACVNRQPDSSEIIVCEIGRAFSLGISWDVRQQADPARRICGEGGSGISSSLSLLPGVGFGKASCGRSKREMVKEGKANSRAGFPWGLAKNWPRSQSKLS